MTEETQREARTPRKENRVLAKGYIPGTSTILRPVIPAAPPENLPHGGSSVVPPPWRRNNPPAR